ncbi:hypothetical protein RHGRI_010313 [Rhododendron griersonianum]|uniref:Uncharacterized protein n=1 Tax=Rhododendron griersonianum TaxID=479676 RepID=A0AAV6KI03_9ERIC|nr:hypothetical protein RHGRI_010313 [Rhododendron griersonianum]
MTCLGNCVVCKDPNDPTANNEILQISICSIIRYVLKIGNPPYEQEELEKKMADYAAKMLNKVALIHKEAQEKKAMVAGKTRGRNAQGRGARCKAPCNWNCSEEAWVPWLLEINQNPHRVSSPGFLGPRPTVAIRKYTREEKGKHAAIPSLETENLTAFPPNRLEDMSPFIDPLNMELLKSSLGQPSCFDTGDFQCSIKHLVEDCNDDFEGLVRLELLDHLVCGFSKTEENPPQKLL